MEKEIADVLTFLCASFYFIFNCYSLLQIRVFCATTSLNEGIGWLTALSAL
jgi:hypothetical protein